jgi:hypothetical protein
LSGAGVGAGVAGVLTVPTTTVPPTAAHLIADRAVSRGTARRAGGSVMRGTPLYRGRYDP